MSSVAARVARVAWRRAALYLPCISPVFPLYLPYISPVSPLYLPCIFVARVAWRRAALRSLNPTRTPTHTPYP